MSLDAEHDRLEPDAFITRREATAIASSNRALLGRLRRTLKLAAVLLVLGEIGLFGLLIADQSSGTNPLTCTRVAP